MSCILTRARDEALKQAAAYEAAGQHDRAAICRELADAFEAERVRDRAPPPQAPLTLAPWCPARWSSRKRPLRPFATRRRPPAAAD